MTANGTREPVVEVEVRSSSTAMGVKNRWKSPCHGKGGLYEVSATDLFTATRLELIQSIVKPICVQSVES